MIVMVWLLHQNLDFQCCCWEVFVVCILNLNAIPPACSWCILDTIQHSQWFGGSHVIQVVVTFPWCTDLWICLKNSSPSNLVDVPVVTVSFHLCVPFLRRKVTCLRQKITSCCSEVWRVLLQAPCSFKYMFWE